MKILVLGQIQNPISLQTPGGTEVFTYSLVRGLEKRGHDVALIASEESGQDFEKVRLLSVFSSEEFDKKTSMEEDSKIPELALAGYKNKAISILLQSWESFDVIHNSTYDNYLLFPFSTLISKPIIHNVHDDYLGFEVFGEFVKKNLPHKDFLVFVSEYALRHRGLGRANDRFIYNGTDTFSYSFVTSPQTDTMVWMSRLVEKKGPREAIDCAIRSRKRIVLSSPPLRESEEHYFSEAIQPLLLEDTIVFQHPRKDISTILYKQELLGNAKLFLFPVLWEEPFGLVLTEAMATGTPVVSYARGAIPEIVKDGETGFIVNPSDHDRRGDWSVKESGIEGLTKAIERIYSLSDEEYKKMRQNCRTHIEKNFTVEKMVSEYEELYTSVLKTA